MARSTSSVGFSLAASADEPLAQNFVRKHALKYQAEHGCDLETAALRVYSNADGAYGANGSGTALRQNNSIRYVSPSFSGFGFALMRAFGEQAGDTSRFVGDFSRQRVAVQSV